MNKRRSIVLYAQETTRGTAMTSLTGTSNGGYNIYDFDFDPPNNLTELPAQASTEILGVVDGVQDVSFSFKTDYDGDPAGAGAVPTWAIFLLISGFTASTGTYTWTDDVSLQKTGTFAYYMDGWLHTFAGCALSPKVVLKNGERGHIEWTGKGKYKAEQSASLPTGFTFPGVAGMPRGTGSLSIGGFTPQTQDVVYDIGGQIATLPDISDATGVAYCLVPSRRTTLQINPAAITSQDWNSIKTAGTTQALTLVVGATNRQITSSLSSMFVRERQKVADREGIIVHPILLVGGAALPTFVFA